MVAMMDLNSLSPIALLLCGALAACIMVAVIRQACLPRRRSMVSSTTCRMCHRPTPKDRLNSWHIRRVEHRVCGRCHPFYKLRFAPAQAEPLAQPEDCVEQPEPTPALAAVPSDEPAQATRNRAVARLN